MALFLRLLLRAFKKIQKGSYGATDNPVQNELDDENEVQISIAGRKED